MLIHSMVNDVISLLLLKVFTGDVKRVLIIQDYLNSNRSSNLKIPRWSI